MLGYSPIAGSALASSGHEIIIVSLDHGSFATTGQAVGTNIAISDGFGTGSFATTGQTINSLFAVSARVFARHPNCSQKTGYFLAQYLTFLSNSGYCKIKSAID